MRYLLLLLCCCSLQFALAQTNISFASKVTFPNQELANIWGFTLGTSEYALIGGYDSLIIIDVTSPTSPVRKASINHPNSDWHEIRTYSHNGIHCLYEVSEGGGGILIANLGSLPGTVTSKFYTAAGQIPGGLSVGTAHALQVDETKGYLYVYGSSLYNGRALIFDLTPDPYNPTYVGYVNTAFSTTNHNYIHDGYADNDMMYGGHIYGGFFSIINTSSKSTSPPSLPTVTTQNTPNNFTHNTWRNGNYLFATDEKVNSFLSAYDISNTGNIKFLDKIQSNPGTNSIVHNTYIKDNYAITSWYTDGITIVDVSRPDNLVQVGNYDTYPSGSGGSFNGAWGVYPFFNSGTLIVSNINGTGFTSGEMWVLTPTYQRGCYIEGLITDAATGNPIADATVELLNATNQVVLSTTSAPSNNGQYPFGEYKMGLLQSGTYTLRVTKIGYQVYTTSISASNGTLTTTNAALISTSAPVELVRFDVESDKNTAQLTWETASEINNKGFYIEHSQDANTWTTLGFQEAKGDVQRTTAYQFKTETLESGLHYFRLRQVDLDGKVNYSQARSVDIQYRPVFAQLRPNVVSDYCEIVINTDQHAPVSIAICNAAGQIVEQVTSVEVEETLQMPLTISHLSPGTYYVRIQQGQYVQMLPMLKR